MKNIRKFISPLLPLTLVAVLFVTSNAKAFFDEVVSLKKELQMWEVTHASNFSDVVARLDTIAGSVFIDVSEDDWFNPYVNSLAEWGVVSGYADAAGRSTGEFRPGNEVTVAEVLKMAVEAARIDEQTCTGTPRHPEAYDHWARPYVVCSEGMDMRITSGPNLDLNRPARRAEVVAIMHDAFKDSVPRMYASFSDTPNNSFEADIAFAALRGIVSGDTDADGNSLGTFRPNASINRAEVSKIIYQRLKEQAKKELSLGSTPSSL